MNADLPIAVTLAKDLPAKLSVQPQLPELRGTAKSSFEYTLTIRNDSGKDLPVRLAAAAPPGFQTSWTEGYGTQEISSLPVEAGQTKDVKIKVTPPGTVSAGDYQVVARVAAEDCVGAGTAPDAVAAVAVAETGDVAAAKRFGLPDATIARLLGVDELEGRRRRPRPGRRCWPAPGCTSRTASGRRCATCRSPSRRASSSRSSARTAPASRPASTS
jgi:hypothetical protein